MANSIASYKAAYDAAKAVGNTAGMKAAHTGADSLRGYTTDASGTYGFGQSAPLGAGKGGDAVAGINSTPAMGGQSYAAGQSGNPNAFIEAGSTDPRQYQQSPDLSYSPQSNITQHAVAGIPQQSTQVDNSAYIQQLADAKKANQIAGLEKARTNALGSLDSYKTNTLASLDTQKGGRLSDLNSYKTNTLASLDTQKGGMLSNLQGEQAKIDPMYYDKRNQAAASSDVGALNFAQYMAARGIKGNAGAMPEIYRNAGLQGQIGALDQQQGQAQADIARRESGINNDYQTKLDALNSDIGQRTLSLNNDYQTNLNALNADTQAKTLGINNNYQTDLTAANANIDSQTMQNFIDQNNKNREYNLQKQQADAQATGYYNPYAGNTLTSDIQSQLAPYANDYQAFINANPDSPLVPFAQNARYQKTMSNPDLQGKYAQQYQTVAGMTAGLQNTKQELDNTNQAIQNSYLPQTLKLQAQQLAQQVRSGSLSYDTALAQLNQIKAQTNATNAGVVTNAFNAQTDATYKQGLLANGTNKSLAAGKLKAMSYFDTFKNPASASTPWNDQQPTIDQRNNLKQFYGTELDKILTNPNPAQAIQDPMYRQSIIDTYNSWTGNHILTALENTLQNYTPGE